MNKEKYEELDFEEYQYNIPPQSEDPAYIFYREYDESLHEYSVEGLSSIKV